MAGEGSDWGSILPRLCQFIEVNTVIVLALTAVVEQTQNLSQSRFWFRKEGSMKVQVRIFEGKYRKRTRFLWWPKGLPFASSIDHTRREWRWLEIATWRQQTVRSIDMAGGQYLEWKDLGWL